MATKKPKGLGLGLEALLGPSALDGRQGEGGRGNEPPSSLPLDRLQAGRYQPRTQMDDTALHELADSIKAQGVMQPVLVRPVAGGAAGQQRYEIIAGERRFRAASLAGLDRIPVLVRDVADDAAAAMALIENMQREDLNPLEEARGLKRLTEEFGMTHDAVARAVGRSRSAASNLLRLLQLSAPVQQLLMSGQLEMGHARALLPLDGATQILCANEIVARTLSVAKRNVWWPAAPPQRHPARLRPVSARPRHVISSVSSSGFPTCWRRRSRSACAGVAPVPETAARSPSPSRPSTC